MTKYGQYMCVIDQINLLIYLTNEIYIKGLQTLSINNHIMIPAIEILKKNKSLIIQLANDNIKIQIKIKKNINIMIKNERRIIEQKKRKINNTKSAKTRLYMKYKSTI